MTTMDPEPRLPPAAWKLSNSTAGSSAVRWLGLYAAFTILSGFLDAYLVDARQLMYSVREELEK